MVDSNIAHSATSRYKLPFGETLLSQESITALYNEVFARESSSLKNLVIFAGLCSGKSVASLLIDNNIYTKENRAIYSSVVNNNSSLSGNKPAIFFNLLSDVFSDRERFAGIPESYISSEAIRDAIIRVTTRDASQLADESIDFCNPRPKKTNSFFVINNKFENEYNSTLYKLEDAVSFFVECESALISDIGIDDLALKIKADSSMMLSCDDSAILTRWFKAALEDRKYSHLPSEAFNTGHINALINTRTEGYEGPSIIEHPRVPASVKKTRKSLAKEVSVAKALYKKEYPSGFQSLRDMVMYVATCEAKNADDFGVENLAEKLENGTKLVGDEPHILSDALYKIFEGAKYEHLPLDQIAEDRINLLIAQHIDPSSTLSPASAEILSDVHDRIIDGIGFGR